MNSSIPVHPLTRVPPPLLFLGTFLLGVMLQQLDPVMSPNGTLATVIKWLGVLLLAGGIALAAICIRLFVTAHTTLIPFATATTLVRRGPYRVTRNPMYLSLTIAYLGAVALLMQFWSLMLLPLPLMVVNSVVIPGEEARLREKFGESFLEYCTHVKRWL